MIFLSIVDHSSLALLEDLCLALLAGNDVLASLNTFSFPSNFLPASVEFTFKFAHALS